MYVRTTAGVLDRARTATECPLRDRMPSPGDSRRAHTHAT
jgi:hypothetical protein